MESQFGSNSMMEFEAKIPKKLGCPSSLEPPKQDQDFVTEKYKLLLDSNQKRKLWGTEKE